MSALSISSASTRRFATFFLVMVFGLLQAACGGGGGSPVVGGNGSVSGNGSIKLALTDASGAAKTETSSTAPLTAKATVVDDAGRPVKGKIVTFSLSTLSAVLSPSSGSVLTDDAGVAQITVTGTASGAGAVELSASVTVGTTAVSSKIAFTVVPAKSPTIRLFLLDAAGVAKNSLSGSTPLTARASVLDGAGLPLKNTVVTFRVNGPLATTSPASGTALTNDNGIADISVVSSGAGAGATDITASITSGTTVLSATQAFSVGSGGSIGAGTIRIALYEPTGKPSNLVTAGAPLVVRATVTDDVGNPVADKVVSFSLSSSIAVLSPASGTALTNSSGVAQLNLQSNGAAGAAEITATVAVGSSSASAKAAFAVGAAASATPVAINFVSATPSSASIVIRGSGGNGRTEVALLTFKVVDSSNVGIANVPVSFTTGQAVTLAASSGVTDQNGDVTVALSSGNTVTSVRVTATVAGTSISTLSDQVTVTTGQPVQSAFSMALEKFYVEGANADGTTMKVTVSLGDAKGGAVADGTAVVFTTDAGVIVGTGGARCLTTQGTCTVNWRSQNPRTTSGIATIVATSAGANGAQLTASSKFYVSGSFATVFAIASGASYGSTTRTTTGGTIPLNFSSSCASQSFDIEVVDINGNPMPEGSVISIANTRNVTASVAPSTVVYTGNLATGSSTRGSLHTVAVQVPNCVLGSGKSATGTFDINVKTPLGGQANTRVSLGTYPYNATLTPD